MVDFTREELDAFLSKTDFDFSQVSDWQEFLAERSTGGAGRDADGIQLRDIKNYSVGVATVITKSSPVTAQFSIRTLGSGLALPPGALYVFHPDASWNMTVSRFYVGPPGSSIDFLLEVGGPTADGRENWGSLYYIIIKSEKLPGQSVAEMVGKKALRRSLEGGSWLLRRGFWFLTFGEAGYSVAVKVGSGEWTRDYFLQQEILSEELQGRIQDSASRAWEALKS